MKLAIIAGGKGTRLGFKAIPKPMIKIGDKPLLEHQILLAKKYGIEEIYILSGHLAGVIVDYFGDGEDWDVVITHIVENKSLGTAGALKQLEGVFDDRFMVFYGDTIMDIDLTSFIEFDAAQDNSIGSIIVHPNDHPCDSDLVEVDINHKVLEFQSKPRSPDVYYDNFVNAALYILSPKIFQYIDKNMLSDFGKDIFPRITKRHNLYAYKTTEYLKDMGTPERLNVVEKDYMSGKIARLNKSLPQKAIFLDRDGVINKEVGNLSDIEDFSLIDDATKAIKYINKSNFISIVITNQPGIAKGFISASELSEIHKKLYTLLGQEGAYIDDLYFCPHHPEKGFEGEVTNLKIECNCRKPKSGMFFKAASNHNIDLQKSWMIGDRYVDIKAAHDAGCRTILVNTGYAGRDKDEFVDTEANYIFETLFDAIVFILKMDDTNDNN